MAFQSSRNMGARLLRARTQLPAPSSRLLIVRPYSSEAPAPPLLQKLKADLKTAMRAKDTARLTVVRSILAATLNASKTANPITTDAQLVALLRKTARASEEASEDFKGAGREDLVEKEQAQIKVLEAYVAESGIESVTEEMLKEIVATTVKELAAEGGKPKLGDVMKKILAAGGPLDGKDVDKVTVSKVVKEVVG